MSITQTVDIPANHRLTIDVPREVPEGRTILIFKPAADQRSVDKMSVDQRSVDKMSVDKMSAERSDVISLPGGSARTVEEALQMAAEKAADPNREPISRFFGILSSGTFGDGVAYQRKLRDEWDD